MTAIVIGSIFSNGLNSQFVAETKAQAIDVLRFRGVARNVARSAVNAAIETCGQFKVFGGVYGNDVIEVRAA